MAHRREPVSAKRQDAVLGAEAGRRKPSGRRRPETKSCPCYSITSFNIRSYGNLLENRRFLSILLQTVTDITVKTEERNMSRFSIYPRKDSPYLYAELKNPITGEYLTQKSTRQTDRAKAEEVVRDWEKRYCQLLWMEKTYPSVVSYAASSSSSPSINFTSFNTSGINL